MKPLSFGRVLAGAVAGFAAAAFFAVWAGGWLDWPRILLSWTHLLGVAPFGAILGVRLAAGKGGVARWVALLASWAVWAALAGALFWPLHSGVPRTVLLASGMALVGGWASLIWRSLRILSGGVVRSGPGALSLMGFATGRAILVGGDGLLLSVLMRIPGVEAWMLFGCMVTMVALALTCGVGVQASLAARMDLSWAGVASSAAVLGVLEAASFYMLLHRVGTMGDWMFLFPIVLEAAWFATWGHRLSRAEPES